LKALVCERCGANDLKYEGDYMVCIYCGSRFLPAANETAPHKTRVSSFGGSSAVSNIAISDDVAQLLNKCKTDRKNAKKYANLILDLDPDNEEALKYL